jgi:hypothetical protein
MRVRFTGEFDIPLDGPLDQLALDCTVSKIWSCCNDAAETEVVMRSMNLKVEIVDESRGTKGT